MSHLTTELLSALFTTDKKAWNYGGRLCWATFLEMKQNTGQLWLRMPGEAAAMELREPLMG